MVGIADNGLKAIELIKKTEPDFVILDYIMPQLGGLEVLEELHRLELKCMPQIIMISAFVRDSITQMAMNLGAEYFILKPFDLKVLSSRILQLYSLRKFKEIKDFYSGDIVNTDTKSKITEMLARIGVPSHLKGYDYLECSIEILLEDLTAFNSITKHIYMRISKKYNSTPSKVERSIRNAIDQTWVKGNIDFIDEIFWSCVSDEKPKPSNSDFLIKIVTELMK